MVQEDFGEERHRGLLLEMAYVLKKLKGCV
jgi:hypothetical protein